MILKASYFAAAKPGPGVLLLHQINRTRKSWDDLAGQLAAAGINTLTLDMRGFGESGSPYTKLTDAERAQVRKMWPGDVDTAWHYLVSQPGVKRDVIGVGGTGWFGVLHSVEVARQHAAEAKSLVLLSGETLQDGLQFLRQASQLPGLFVVADDDEYPPTVEAMELLYITASNPGKKFVHYSAAQDAPWIWYETSDVSKVPANGGHGTDLFTAHPELPGIIVDWFLTTLIKTPGHSPADTVASAAIIDQIRTPLAESPRPGSGCWRPARKIPKRSCGRKLPSTSLAMIICAQAKPNQGSRSSSLTCSLTAIRPTRMPTSRKLIWRTGRRIWPGSMPRRLWPCWIPMRRQHLRGPIPNNGAVRFVTTCRMYSRRWARTVDHRA
jgi:dienelactone hydrolase